MSPRFIIGNASLKNIRELSDDIYAIDLIKNNSILVIADASYYILNEPEIKKWCEQSLTTWSQKGMILGFINDEERNLFLMRWS
jgi:hypothetical protein